MLSRVFAILLGLFLSVAVITPAQAAPYFYLKNSVNSYGAIEAINLDTNPDKDYTLSANEENLVDDYNNGLRIYVDYYHPIVSYRYHYDQSGDDRGAYWHRWHCGEGGVANPPNGVQTVVIQVETDWRC